MLYVHGDGGQRHSEGQGPSQLRPVPGLQPPPRRGHAVAGQASATAAAFPASSCSGVTVTAGPPRRLPQAPSQRLVLPAPWRDALPRMPLPERGARFPAEPCLGRANVAPSLQPPLALQAFAGIFLSRPRSVFGGTRWSERVNHPNKDITLTPCYTHRLPNRRREMEEWCHLYNSALKISLFCI